MILTLLAEQRTGLRRGGGLPVSAATIVHPEWDSHERSIWTRRAQEIPGASCPGQQRFNTDISLMVLI